MAGGGACFVDVREARDFDALAFEVPESLNIPLSQLPQRLSELPRDRDLIVVCLDGKRSEQAVQVLKAQGFTRATPMRGGLLLWMQKGYAVVGQRYVAPVTDADPQV